MAGLSYNVSELENALMRLRQRWNAAAAVWNDAARRQFEREYWQEIERQAHETARAMAQLGELIAQAQRAVH